MKSCLKKLEVLMPDDEARAVLQELEFGLGNNWWSMLQGPIGSEIPRLRHW